MSSNGGSNVETRLDQRRGGLVAVVTVNNPSRLNSMNSALMDEFIEAFLSLAANAELRAVVLTGAGAKAFIGGADIREMSALTGAEDGRRFITRLHRCCDRPRACNRPDQRIDVGGRPGNCRCLRRAHRSGKRGFGMPEVKLGIPSVIEAALLPMLIGWGRTRQILLFGENFTAQEAHSWGLVNELVSGGDLDNAVGRWLDQLLSCSPGAIRLQKQLIRSWEDMPLRAAIQAGVESFTTVVRSGEPSAAMHDFLDRQKLRETKS